MKEVERTINTNTEIANKEQLQEYSLDIHELAEEYGLKPKQIKAAFLLALGEKKVDIATELKLERKTLYLWMKKPSFVQLYNDLSGYMLKSIQGRAISKLEDLLESKNERIVLDTAKFTITTNMKIVEGVDLTKRDKIEDLIDLLAAEKEEEKTIIEYVAGKEDEREEELYDAEEIMENQKHR